MKKKKEPVIELTALEKELQKVQEALAVTQATDKEYDELLQRARNLEDLIRKEDERKHPKEDKLSKDTKWTIIANLGIAGVATACELRGHIVGKSFNRRFPFFRKKNMG